MKLADVIAYGKKVRRVKSRMKFGEFKKWRRAEYGRRQRTILKWMAVSRWLGNKSANVALLPMSPSACYILAGRALPEEARECALARAMAGKRITAPAALAIVAEFAGAAAADLEEKSWLRVVRELDRHLQQWPDAVVLAARVQDYTGSLQIAAKKGRGGN